MNTITLENKKDKKYEIYDLLVKQDSALAWANHNKTIATGSALSFEVKDDNVIITSNYFTETSLRSFVSEI